MYHLEERSVSNTIRYKKCAQILVLSVNKSPLWCTFRNATESYRVECEHGHRDKLKNSDFFYDILSTIYRNDCLNWHLVVSLQSNQY